MGTFLTVECLEHHQGYSRQTRRFHWMSATEFWATNLPNSGMNEMPRSSATALIFNNKWRLAHWGKGY